MCSTALPYVLALYLAALGAFLLLLLLQQCLLISLNVTGVEIARLRAFLRPPAPSGDECDAMHMHANGGSTERLRQLNGVVDGHPTANGHANGYATANGHANGYSNGYSNGNGIANGGSHYLVERQQPSYGSAAVAPSARPCGSSPSSSASILRSVLRRLPCGCVVEALLCLLFGAFAWLLAPAALWSARYRSPFSQGVVRNWYLFLRAQRNLDSLAALALLNGGSRASSTSSRKTPHLLVSWFYSIDYYSASVRLRAHELALSSCTVTCIFIFYLSRSLTNAVFNRLCVCGAFCYINKSALSSLSLTSR